MPLKVLSDAIYGYRSSASVYAADQVKSIDPAYWPRDSILFGISVL